ncbi:MAG TPA: hypothetical protein VFO03_08145 [Gaiellaceae bacterium]|nr:hypothetical protein [Gaiellaceae bacterium]
MAKRVALLAAVLSLLATSMALASGGTHDYGWQLTPTGSTSHFRGLSAVSERTAWVSGYDGVVLRTTDKGATWQSVGPPGTASLQFRDIEAFDADTAVIMSVGGTPDSFRIYRTEDGGQTWTLAFLNTEPAAFYDCMAFFDRHRGLALSDPIDGRFRILSTSDGGRSWQIVNADMPPALPAEFAFAASGQCLTTAGGRDAWFGTGGDAVARVFHSGDRGQTWTVANTPVRSLPSGGIFALAFRDPLHGIAAGGDFLTPTASPDALALTADGGGSWSLVPNAPNEYRSGAHWVTGTDAIIVGPSGSDVTFDQGRTWQGFDDGSFDTVDCAGDHACWASGELGRVAYLTRD